MCQRCLQIHIEQTADHKNHIPDENILTIYEAIEFSYRILKNHKQNFYKTMRAIQNKINIFKQTLIHQLEEQLQIVKMDLLSKIDALDKYEKCNKIQYMIREGSNKQLIRMFEGDVHQEIGDSFMSKKLANQIQIQFNYNKFRNLISQGFSLKFPVIQKIDSSCISRNSLSYSNSIKNLTIQDQKSIKQTQKNRQKYIDSLSIYSKTQQNNQNKQQTTLKTIKSLDKLKSDQHDPNTQLIQRKSWMKTIKYSNKNNL